MPFFEAKLTSTGHSFMAWLILSLALAIPDNIFSSS
jgi:hypothetical protein